MIQVGREIFVRKVRLEYLAPVSIACIDCSPPLSLLHSACPPDRYGSGCTGMCWCYGMSFCDPLTGVCKCPPGFKGWSCSTGTYHIYGTDWFCLCVCFFVRLWCKHSNFGVCRMFFRNIWRRLWTAVSFYLVTCSECGEVGL